ncbi:hypothetical protein Nepgr_033298 [Nepenthes gracilis]|uniref:Morc S5 domain-containing protein n=1 Tax=Nepenthes gracilis TaxID=150966 RepID=A0AAD3Y8A1_NEPGR|nr:hypothetical protein Nepgr_033298 [Nepenthes gracilis]
MIRASSDLEIFLISDEEMRVYNGKSVKLEPDFDGSKIHPDIRSESELSHLGKVALGRRGEESEENRSSNAFSTGQSGISMLDQAQSLIDDTSPSAFPLSPAPLCRQFWKAGNYDDALASKTRIQNYKNHLHVHPKFLHSNATSHRWAFGAVAELVDNVIDEIQSGAEFVLVDRIPNPRDGSPALLIQDDGGGMDPDAIRCCMSFGFSNKKSKSAIGQYGNGFKTSTMRLGADVIVFSRRKDTRTLTQSIGLLSYSYLARSGLDRIVVPIVDYEVNILTGKVEPLFHHGKESFLYNIDILLRWSPYSTEAELLKQFDDIGSHGTRVIVYNLWFNDDGTLELDFETDPEDIRLRNLNTSNKVNSQKLGSEEHIVNKFHYSLRVYLSILYLRIPENFRMILRGRIVQHHNIANSLKFIEFILYRPQTGGTVEGQVVTTIGFLKEAPRVNIHGFNVYHKNRLILPFWHVISYCDNRGRGVVGVLEANFVEPTHNKQDFEKTSLFQKLENRLKEMTWEYWDHHCGLIGYQVKKSPQVPVALKDSSYNVPKHVKHEPVRLNKISNFAGVKRAQLDYSSLPARGNQRTRIGPDVTDGGNSLEIQPMTSRVSQLNDLEEDVLLEENKKLHARCLEHAKTVQALNNKVLQLNKELEVAQCEYARMLAELEYLDVVKKENNVA